MCHLSTEFCENGLSSFFPRNPVNYQTKNQRRWISLAEVIIIIMDNKTSATA